MGIKLKNSVTAALAPVKSENIGSFTFLGSGGLLDRKEGTMSYLLQLSGNGTILVDCGPRVFDKLYDLYVWDRIKTIVITSSEESSIGSLAAVTKMVYAATKKPVNIVCMPHVGHGIYEYLMVANGFPKEMVSLHTVPHNEGDVALLFTPSIKYTFKKTSDTSSMFIMEIMTKISKIFLVHSGTIDKPAFEFLDETVDDVLSKMRRHPDDVVILHDASFFEKDGRCSFDKLTEWSNTYRNFFLFGHSSNEGKSIVFSQRYMRSLSTNDSNVFLLEKQ